MEKKFSELIKEDKPVLVDFSAEWCGPCKMMAPILKQVKSDLGDQATIIKIDVDKNRELAGSFNIASVPTLMIFRNGQMLWRQSGIIQVNQLRTLLQKYTH